MWSTILVKGICKLTRDVLFVDVC